MSRFFGISTFYPAVDTVGFFFKFFGCVVEKEKEKNILPLFIWISNSHEKE